MASGLKLFYFDGKGVAEHTRMMFSLAGQQFEDVRYTDEEFDVQRDNGAFAINLDRAPMLQGPNGFVLGQSKPIERYVARKFGFFGASEEEGAIIDMLCEHVRDIKQKYGDARQGKTGDELAEAKKVFLEQELPKWMKKVERCLSASGAPFAVGAKLSLADLTLFSVVSDFFDYKEAATLSVAECPRLQGAVAATAAALKGYLETRKVTDW
jgi:glutathione S-transferase